MQDTAFFQQLLGIKDPWYVTKVTQDHDANRVDLYVEHKSGIRFPCPECEQFCSVYDHTEEREFRHLNVCQMKSYIHVRIPRVRCQDHGIQQVVHGLAESNGRVSYEFESLVLDFAHECSLESISRLLNIDWHLCQSIQTRAVERGRARKEKTVPKRIGVDEKSLAKGHKYETLVYDIDKGCVEYVCDNRDQQSLESDYKQFSSDALKGVKAVAMDMWDPYIAATRACVPDASHKIVFDRYHVMRLVLKAVDSVRKQEHRSLSRQDNETLKGTKYLWLWSKEHLPDYWREEFERLRNQDLKVYRAYAIKENLRNMWQYQSSGWMRRFFNDWYRWARRSRLQPIKKAAQSLKDHIDNIVTYAQHHITNALGESLNGKIEKVKRLACGYRNREHYRNAINFHCGGLDLYPKRRTIALQVISS